MSTIGWKIRNLREINQWSQLQLAKQIGLHNSILSKIESDKRPVESDLLVKLAEVFQVSADYLVGRSPHKQWTFDKPAITENYKSSPEPHQPGTGTVIKESSGAQKVYYYIVTDESMAQEGITIGTKVLIQGQHYIEEGQIALVSWNGADVGVPANLGQGAETGVRSAGIQATLRRVYFIGNQIVLQAANPLIPPVVLPIHAAKILGQALEYTVSLK